MASPPSGLSETDTGEGLSLAGRVAAARNQRDTGQASADSSQQLTRYQRRSAHLPSGIGRFSGDEISLVVDLRGEEDDAT